MSIVWQHDVNLESPLWALMEQCACKSWPCAWSHGSWHFCCITMKSYCFRAHKLRVVCHPGCSDSMHYIKQLLHVVEVWKPTSSYQFHRMCCVQLGMIICCCTSSLVCKLCIRNKIINVSCIKHDKSIFTCIPMMSLLCQYFLSVRLLSIHGSTYNIAHPSFWYFFIYTNYFDFHSTVSTLSIRILHFDCHFLDLYPMLLQLCWMTLGPKENVVFLKNWQ